MTTVAGFDLKGFDELMQKFERLKEKSVKNGKAIVNDGAKIVLEQQKKDTHGTPGKGTETIKIHKTQF